MSSSVTRSAGQLSLQAGSTTGAGASLDNGGACANHTVVTVASAGITAGAVQLQGSIDNQNWVNLGSPITLTASAVQTASVSGAPFPFIRANVSTNLTGGTVSASVASA